MYSAERLNMLTHKNPKPPVGSRIWYLDPPEKPYMDFLRAHRRAVLSALSAPKKKRKNGNA
jgi:hypothetical protein